MSPADKARLLDRLSSILVAHVEPVFQPGALVTLLVRFPGDTENEVLVTSDSDDTEMRAALERGLLRAAVPHPGALS